MKTTFLTTLLLISFIARGAETPTNSPPATITGVAVAKDAHTLVIRYELSGRSHVQRVSFTNGVTDFRYCRWLGEQGIAVVASTRADEFYYAAFYLTGQNTPVSPLRIPSPSSKSRLLGIANTGGDSIVVTAIQHHRNGATNRLSGWMFIDNCPPIGPVARLITSFDIPVEQAGKPK